MAVSGMTRWQERLVRMCVTVVYMSLAILPMLLANCGVGVNP